MGYIELARGTLDLKTITAKEITVKFSAMATTLEIAGVTIPAITYDREEPLIGFDVLIGSKSKDGEFSVKSEAFSREPSTPTEQSPFIYPGIL